MKTTRYILLYIMIVTATGLFAQVSPQPQPQVQPPSQPINPAQGQPASPTQPPVNPAQPAMGLPPLTDPTTTQKLQTDFQSQNNGLGNQPVNWYNNSTNGYIGTTRSNNTTYMMQYDNQGNYQQTFTQGNWNSPNVPASVKSSFNSSQYNSQNVTGFWISSDTTKPTYYLQTTDKQGKVTGLWSDENGKLSSTPPNPNKPQQK